MKQNWVYLENKEQKSIFASDFFCLKFFKLKYVDLQRCAFQVCGKVIQLYIYFVRD